MDEPARVESLCVESVGAELSSSIFIGVLHS